MNPIRFYFVCTCAACPEQYDVYRANGNLCGYVRLRWGALRADYPDVEGKTIYYHKFHDAYKGSFDSDEECDFHLQGIAEALAEEILSSFMSTDHIKVSYKIIDFEDIKELIEHGEED